MRDIELLKARRQILDWREKWLPEIPQILARDLPTLIALLNRRIEQISYRETFKTDAFIKKNLHPIYERWAEREAREVLRLAERDLVQINQSIHNYNHKVDQANLGDTSLQNAINLGVAAGTTGAALIGLPAVTTLSVQSAGWGLGLLGVTVISWPVALGGAAVIGSLAFFGSSRISNYKNKAILELQETINKTIKEAVLGSGLKDNSLESKLQCHIKDATSRFLEELSCA